MATLVNGLRLIATLLLPTALLLALALPVAAAPNAGAGGGGIVRAQLVDGTICGSVTEFTAASGSADGSITINGTSDPIATGTVVDGTLAAALDLATTAAPVTACLNLTVDEGSGEVTGITAATSGRICGAVTATGSGTGRTYTIGGVVVPPTATLDAQLRAWLDAAINASGSVCLDVTASATTGAITAAANLDASLEICAVVTATGSGDARTYTVGGVVIPAAQLSAAERATLDLAAANNATACVRLEIVDTQLVSAAAEVEVCVTVTAVTATSITADGVTIPLAAGTTVPSEVRAGATIGLRLAVSASDTLSLNVVSLAGCTAAGTAGAGAGAGLPNTATSESPAPLVAAGVLLVGLGAVAARRRLATVAS